MWRIRNVSFLLCIAICLTVFYACANLKKTDNTSKEWSIELVKGGCMDVCDAYTLHVSQDGAYVYKGTFNVKHLGKKTGEIQSEELVQLELLISAIDWPEKDITYGTRAEDSSGKKLSYLSENREKTINYFRAEPREIRILEKFIDKIIDRDDF